MEQSTALALVPENSKTKYIDEWAKIIKFLRFSDLFEIYQPSENELLGYFSHQKAEKH